MKAQIQDALKAKFEGVSDSILSRIATNMAKTVTTEEQMNAAVEAMTFQKILDSYGDSRATEAQQTAISNYEKKHGLKDGQKVSETNKDGGAPSIQNKEPDTSAGEKNGMPEWAKALLDSNKALNERLNKLDSERTTASRKQQLSELIGKLPNDNLRKAYERTPIDNLSDEQFDELKDTISTEVEAINSSLNVKGAVFGKPTASNGTGLASGKKEATADEVQAIVDKLPI